MTKATILIVEDEITLNEAYSFVLKKEKFHTFSAFNGKEALAVLDKENVDLILLDLRMPKMNGLEFLQKLRKKRGTPPKIIIFSNYDNQKEIDKAFKYGADKYMLKAWASPKELVKLVSDLLSDDMQGTI